MSGEGDWQGEVTQITLDIATFLHISAFSPLELANLSLKGQTPV